MESAKYFGRSVKGRREYNQDSFIAEKLTGEAYLFAIADGMGGTTGGEIAAQLSLDTILEFLKVNFRKKVKLSQLKDLLKGAFEDASAALKKKKSENESLSGMGTTLTAILLCKKHYVIGHIGDSRAYLIEDNIIRQITKDHTFLDDYMTKNKGPLPNEIKKKYSHYLLKALDGNSLEADFYPVNQDTTPLPENCAFLLCSDGLILDKENTNTNLFKNYIIGAEDCKTSAEQLVNYAYPNGSTDNIYAQLIK